MRDCGDFLVLQEYFTSFFFEWLLDQSFLASRVIIFNLDAIVFSVCCGVIETTKIYIKRRRVILMFLKREDWKEKKSFNGIVCMCACARRFLQQKLVVAFQLCLVVVIQCKKRKRK